MRFSEIQFDKHPSAHGPDHVYAVAELPNGHSVSIVRGNPHMRYPADRPYEILASWEYDTRDALSEADVQAALDEGERLPRYVRGDYE